MRLKSLIRIIHRSIQHMKLKIFVDYRVCIWEQTKIWTAVVELLSPVCPNTALSCPFPADIPYAEPWGRGVWNPTHYPPARVRPRTGHGRYTAPLSGPWWPAACTRKWIYPSVPPTELGSSLYYNIPESRGARRRHPQQWIAYGRSGSLCVPVA